MFKKILCVLVLIAVWSTTTGLQASDQRYVITEAGERIFLLDTQDGAVWRYFYNGDSREQGWERTIILISSDKDNNNIAVFPYGETYSIPKK